uniref:Uncharacterized protein n=1 Tax=Arundo donax TaxID=35708 RepID=A0A0A8ZWG2_ARUDO
MQLMFGFSQFGNPSYSRTPEHLKELQLQKVHSEAQWPKGKDGLHTLSPGNQ